jgi:uncharacterized membrane protein YeaQ/YmgE (transglycosylase-associated protein family)
MACRRRSAIRVTSTESCQNDLLLTFSGRQRPNGSHTYRRSLINTFATVTFDPIYIVCWLAVGAIAGCLAERVMRRGGFGLVGDIIAGTTGSLVGGFLYGLITASESGVIESTLVAFIGACILITVVRFVVPRRSQF